MRNSGWIHRHIANIAKVEHNIFPWDSLYSSSRRPKEAEKNTFLCDKICNKLNLESFKNTKLFWYFQICFIFLEKKKNKFKTKCPYRTPYLKIKAEKCKIKTHQINASLKWKKMFIFFKEKLIYFKERDKKYFCLFN